MRILLAHHAPPGSDTASRRMQDLAVILEDHGMEVRQLYADVGSPMVLSARGDLGGAQPRSNPSWGPSKFVCWPDLTRTFFDLSRRELADYRQRLRQVLDETIESFDPHVVHCQHVGVLAHLTLESGAPYVVHAGNEEIALLQADDSWTEILADAAFNAGCLWHQDEWVARWWYREGVDLEKILTWPEVAAKDLAAHCLEIYTRAVEQRLMDPRDWE